jgi:AdoMet-dependent heme synthase
MSRLFRTLELGMRVSLAKIGVIRPIYAHYGVTHRCNMRCRMCVVWKDGDQASELPITAIRPMARELVRAGIRMVALGGGEPSVRADLPDIVEAFAGQGADVRILTNGIHFPDDLIASVVRAGARHVSISLDTLDPAREQDIYSGQDVWNRIVDTMRRFRKALKPPAIPIMNVCVSRLNMAELPQLVQFAVREGFFCSFVPIALSPSELASDGFAACAPDLSIRPEDHAQVTAAYGELLRLKRAGAPIANSSRFLRDSLDFLKTGRCNWSCDAGGLYFSVSPRGDISVCHRFPPVARFDTHELAARLTSPEVRRLAAEEARACPGCMRPCWAEITHAARDWPTAWETARLWFRGGARLRQPGAEGAR